MPPRFAPPRPIASAIVLILATISWCASPLAGQNLPLVRDYPGSGRYQCPAPGNPAPPPEEDLRRAAQLASDANQAMNLGDFERAQAVLSQATELDPTSADFAYRHARTLEDLGDAENALIEYCRALALDIEALGVFDARDRIDALYEQVRERIPEAAREAFVRGLTRADSNDYQGAAEAFSDAIDAATDWSAPVYNRGLIYEELGRIQESLADYRRYVELAPTDVDPVLVIVSERIGQLEGAASAAAPSPGGALALGVVPGMGHYYSGRPVAGTLTLVAAGAAIASGLMFRNIITLCVEEVPAGGTCPPNQIHDEITERPYLWHGIGVAAAVTIGGAIEALIHAKRRRAEAEAITGPARDRGGPTLGLPTIEADGPRVDLNLLTLRFR